MSMIDATMSQDEHQTSALPAPETLPHEGMPRIETPIVPKTTIAGRALVAVVAIMTFLASLTIGAVMLVRAAASDWQSEVAREATIQIRPMAGRDIEDDIGRAVIIARSFAGIDDVRPYSREESTGLLEPWLGAARALADLPVPRVIAVRFAPGAPPDLAQLRQALVEQVPSASLDDHREFVARMRTVTRTVVAGGVGVLLLVVIATMLSVTFATRGAMATNRPVVEVLHFVGAKNSFIAGHFQRHFLVLGLKGGAIGGGGAILLFLIGELATAWFRGSVGGDQMAALFGTFAIGPVGYGAVVAMVVLIAIVTAATSRYTVNRTLDTIQ
jgi:cell division transport system permease protein